MVSRELVEAESDRHVIRVGCNGVDLIVHADNPVGALAREQVNSVYRGEIDDWRRLGGRPGQELTAADVRGGRD